MILTGDCRDVLPTLEAESIDACVTDPPYELGFMGKAWDASGIAYDVEMWRAVLRVLKPGAHLLAFGGTRTHHRMVCAIEDAGFEIRDEIQWLYGSGFPKSLDVSKAIDKAERREYVLAAMRLGLEIPGNNLHDWTKAEHSPGDAWWKRFKAVLAPEQWEAIEREVIGRARWDNSANHFVPGEDHTQRVHLDVTAPATDAARQWEGWGTALKPACEPICVARKPLVGTVAANVQEHGTGALNIDGCRVEASDGLNRSRPPRTPNTIFDRGRGTNLTASPHNDTGRWPANVILDEAAAAMLDEQSGTLTSGDPAGAKRRTSSAFMAHAREQDLIGYGDTGGASRFFYVAKPAGSERGEGNTHPTVKPVTLLRYLVRLVTPPGGIVLDPFAGSGTTLWAAQEEGFRYVGIELNPEYVRIAEKRTAQQTIWTEPAA